MSSPERRDGVGYEAVGDDYFDKRQLRRHARVGSLWALGVGAVISGDFFGWNFGLAAGGFGGLLLATGIITLMYGGLCFSITLIWTADVSVRSRMLSVMYMESLSSLAGWCSARMYETRLLVHAGGDKRHRSWHRQVA